MKSREMSAIRFKPYVGKSYHQQELKILVLGESHYLKEEELQSFYNNIEDITEVTRKVVHRFLDYKNSGSSYEGWMNTFTKFSNVISNTKLSNRETVDFWEKCAFYNYVQVPTKGPRIAPTPADFQNSENAFEKVIDELKPNIIFLWGYRLWGKFPKHKNELIKFQTFEINTLKLDYTLPIVVLPHPSSSSFNLTFYDRIQNALEFAKMNRKTI